MRCKRTEKHYVLADGAIEVTVSTDEHDAAQQVIVQGVKIDAAVLLRCAALLRDETRASHHICPDHGEYRPEPKTYECPRCKQNAAQALTAGAKS